MAMVGRFKYRLALDPRLLARIVDESETVHEKIEALRKWATYGNKRIAQIKNAPETAWFTLMDGSIGAFELDRKRMTNQGPFPRPICGQQAFRDGLLCLAPRGSGSKHPGRGLCYTCEMKSAGALYRSGAIYKPGNQKMIAMNRNNRLPATLRECLDATDEVETKTLRAINTDLKTLYALIQYVLEGGLHNYTEEEMAEKPNWLNSEDVKTVNLLGKSILEAKKVAYLMEKDAKLDPVTIKAFVGQVMAVVMANVEPNTARRIGGEIMDTVIRPFRMEGRIGGDDAEYSDISSGMIKSIAAHAKVEPGEVDFSSNGGNQNRRAPSIPSGELDAAAQKALAAVRGKRRTLEKNTKGDVSGEAKSFSQIRNEEKRENKRKRRRNRAKP